MKILTAMWLVGALFALWANADPAVVWGCAILGHMYLLAQEIIDAIKDRGVL